jgi:hypothetical protein
MFSALALLIVVMIWNWPTANGSNVGTDYVAAPVYDVFTTDTLGSPDHGVYQKWRSQRRDGVGKVAKSLPSTSESAGAYVNDNIKSAETVRDYRVGEAKLRAVADGRTLADKPDPVIRADEVGWQMTYCQNTAGQTVPCEFSVGDTIEAYGTVTSRAIRESDNSIVPIGPCGIHDVDKDSQPYVPGLPRYAAIGRMRFTGGGYSEPFRICGSTTLPGRGFLEVRVNGDYRDKFGRTHDEWFGELNRGSFKLRLNK